MNKSSIISELKKIKKDKKVPAGFSISSSLYEKIKNEATKYGVNSSELAEIIFKEYFK